MPAVLLQIHTNTKLVLSNLKKHARWISLICAVVAHYCPTMQRIKENGGAFYSCKKKKKNEVQVGVRELQKYVWKQKERVEFLEYHFTFSLEGFDWHWQIRWHTDQFLELNITVW